MPHLTKRIDDEFAQLDALSRTRALTWEESDRLATIVFRMAEREAQRLRRQRAARRDARLQLASAA